VCCSGGIPLSSERSSFVKLPAGLKCCIAAEREAISFSPWLGVEEHRKARGSMLSAVSLLVKCAVDTKLVAVV